MEATSAQGLQRRSPNWSPKQRSFMRHSTAFFNLAHGAVRAGKTHAALIAFSRYCVEGPPGRLAVFGKTERTIRENVVYPLIDGLPKGAVRHVQGSGEVYIFGRACRLFGASDARAVEKVQGSTLSGGYMNEATLYPEDLFNMAISRSLTIPDARWFADCNPDSPYHWLYRNFITAGHHKAYFKDWPFRVTDNPILPAANVEMLKTFYGGPGTLFYRRYINGEWVQAEGAVYDMFDSSVHVVSVLPESFERYVVGVDYGTANATVFLLLGKAGRNWYVVSEWRHDSRKAGSQKTDADYSADFASWLSREGVVPSAIEVDPSAASFKAQLRRDGVRKLSDANNDVIDGIRTVSTALSSGRLFVHESCENLVAEMSAYRWDEKAQEKGEDKPVKEADHGPDALRYAVMRVFGSQPQRALRLVR